MRKLLSLFFIGFFFVLLFLPRNVFAAQDFSTSYNITYTVNPDGLTQALIKVALTNNTSEVYASSYKVQVGFSNIKNVKASDPLGSITPQISKSSEGNIIGLTFNKKNVGKDHTLNFTISFDTPDVAHKQGSIWEINIPGLANQNAFSGFTVTVVPPKSFGNPTYIKPSQTDNKLVFTKDQLGKSGISIAFGDRQIYHFHLTYYLQNTNVFPITSTVALPPSTNYQDVAIDTITPKPSNIAEDKDGNWLAQYALAPAQKMDIVVDGRAAVYLLPKQQPLAKDQFASYLQEQPYWEVSNGQIKALAQKLKTPDAIYKYVVQSLTYDFSRVTENKSRQGALATLQDKKSAACLEFTDLFVALARAAGIPAREVDGFAYTQNVRERPLSLVKDILHAWPEYYDTSLQTWIMVDPTWENTTGGVDYFDTLDFDHLAFVLRGQNSQYPIPAGGYKTNDNSSSKEVMVDFATSFPDTQPASRITGLFQNVYSSFWPVTGSVVVSNQGNVLLSSQNLLVQAPWLTPHTQSLPVPDIPPFGHAQVAVAFTKQSLLTNRKTEFTIQDAGEKLTKTVTITPFVFPRAAILGGAFIAVLAIGVLIIAIKARRVRL